MNRIVFHCDIDCFFAAVEIRDNLEYKNKPVIIGADPKLGKGRGVVSTCSYEARKFGLHSGMPISQAYQNCPHGIYLRPNFEKYSEASKIVMEIISLYSEDFQQVGFDEAYLEMTNICVNFNDAKIIAEKIQNEVSEKVGITISIGIAPTKSLAKIATDVNKPKGITIFTPENFKDFLKDMDVTKISGIGKKSKIYYNKKGFVKISDILSVPLVKMIELFGKHGEWVWKVVNGLDNRKIKEFDASRKSISKERTFFEDTNDFNFIFSKIIELNDKTNKTIKKHNLSFKTISLKIRFERFKTYTRSKTLSFPIQDKDKVIEVILELYNEFSKFKEKVRLIGIKLSNLEEYLKNKQTTLMNYA